MRSLEQWLAYQAQVHPQAIDLGLDRLRAVLERLAWRQPTIPVITVAGTNGKGSVSAYCTAILGAAGYKVGTFTSPHLRDYRFAADEEDGNGDGLIAHSRHLEHQFIGHGGGNALEKIEIEIGLMTMAMKGIGVEAVNRSPQRRGHIPAVQRIELDAGFGDTTALAFRLLALLRREGREKALK